MQSSRRAANATKQTEQQRHWITSREALGLVSEAYARHDPAKYDTQEARQLAAHARATDALMRRLTEGSLVASPIWFRFVQGNRNDGEECVFRLQEDRTIDPNFWRTLQRLKSAANSDWIAGDFSFEDDDSGFFVTGFASGVKFDRARLPAVEALKAKPNTNPGGSPRKWDWDGALLHLAALAHESPDGLLRNDGKDPNQSDIARFLRAWFIDCEDEAPENSQLRSYGKRFLAELNAIRLRTANNLGST